MKKYALLFLLALPFAGNAQDLDSLMDMANTPSTAKEYVIATFKTTRIINFPSNETVGKRVLDFRIAHRFGDLNSGVKNLYGLDGPASIRLAFDYGINSWLMVGIGRSSYQKLMDGSVKARLLRQTLDNKMPIGVTYHATMNYTLMDDPTAASTGVDKYGYATSRMSYNHSLIIARKFSDRLSLQLNGFYVHYNMVDQATDKNDILAAGISGRFKLKQRMAITFEWAHRVNEYSLDKDKYYNPFGIGIDLETGGHVFQMHFTNAFGMNEAQFIPYNTSNPLKGGLRLGFNISRVFSIGGKKSGSGSSW